MTHRMVVLVLILLALTACATSSQHSATTGKESTGHRPPEAGGY